MQSGPERYSRPASRNISSSAESSARNFSPAQPQRDARRNGPRPHDQHAVTGSKHPRIDDDTQGPPPKRNKEMPPTGRYRGRNRGNGASRAKPPPPPLPELPGPLRNMDYIVHQFGQGITLKQQWQENPKAPLANYLGGGTGGAQNMGDGGKMFQVEEGAVNGEKMFRVTVLVDDERNIIGSADHPNRKEAEKMAAYSAILQLSAYGLLDKPRQKATGVAGVSSDAKAPAVTGSTEVTKLSDGSEITYDRARQFMEYYCQRYKFGKPEIEFMSSQAKIAPRSSKKKGPSGVTNWEAVMTVGGRKIGMGTASNKKGAQIKCYLDVTQYLESCDNQLWTDFIEASKKDPSLNLGMAPHLVFQMSEHLNDEVQGLCGDIRNSLLCYNAPPPNVAIQGGQQMPAWSAGRRFWASESELARKSEALSDKLAQYHIDPNLEKMRATREQLPVHTRATDILAKIEVNDVTIVMAATGSGKTTQVPQLIFDDYINRGDGARCNIVCTQPRRLAAMSVAERVADERGDPLGREVGYQVRFDAKLPQPNGSITFCTTGIFLKRMQSSLGSTAHPDSIAAMDQVTHIVVDEVHERDIDTDLLLVVLKRLLADRKARNKPIKIVLMSATIDPTLFQSYFADDRGRPAPVAEVPGRTFPVDKHYLDDFLPQLREGLPPAMGGWVFQDKKVSEYIAKEMSRDPANFVKIQGISGGELEIPYPLVALTIAYVMRRSTDGHVLVFLPGWDEIKKVADILLDNTGRYPLLGLHFAESSKYSIHYLHSTIPAAEQREVFKPPPPGVRRIILATNIAETSVTIPDVVYVVDTGRVKEKRYDPDRHMSSLVSAWVGSSNIGQRAGRAGRHREGEYFGLLSKMRLNSLDPHQLVEMKRSDLSNVVMHVKALNLGEVEDVLAETIEPPGTERIVAALTTLHMLGALDSNKNLTSLGRVLLQLPTDASIGKLCLYGSFFRCLDSALTLAAVLTNRDPFLAPIAMKQEADAIKDSWSPVAFRSDPLAIVAAFNTWSAMDDRGDYGAGNRFCSDNFLSKPTLLQIKQVKGSLLQSLDQAGVIAVSAGGNVGRIGRRTEVPMALRENDNSLPLLAALIAVAGAPNFAIRTSEKTCRTAQDKTVFIHPSSVNSRKREIGGPELPSASFNPAEKRIYAFGEKHRNVPPGGNPNNALTQLRVVTRLDPMTFMLFGAYDLAVTQRGLECDKWLPVTGNLHALDDIQRLKTLLDRCMLRVFEGVGKSLTRERDERFAAHRNSVDVRAGISRINNNDDLDDDRENESDDEDSNDGMAGASGTARLQYEMQQRQVRKVEPLSRDEIKELEMLTTDVVRILDAYSHEREGANSTYSSRPATPSNMHRDMHTSAYQPSGMFRGSRPGTPSGGPPGGNPNVYRPPGARMHSGRW